jgi:hypothetical protein
VIVGFYNYVQQECSQALGAVIGDMSLTFSNQLRTVPSWTCFMIALLLVPSATHAASIIVGNHTLLANTPNQLVTIQVSGDEQIAGEDFFAQIGDGGVFNGGSNTKPSLMNVSIMNGTIFASNNSGAFGDPKGMNPPGSNAAHPLIWVDGTTTSTGTVAASGLFATLTIDTTGLNSGTFPLILTGVANTLGHFDTTLRDANGDSIPLTVNNGSLTLSSFPTGDYNSNGIVDAADYVVWRKTDGTLADYNVWRAHFGQSDASDTGASATTGVPEPATFVLLMFAAAGWCLRRVRHT